MIIQQIVLYLVSFLYDKLMHLFPIAFQVFDSSLRNHFPIRMEKINAWEIYYSYLYKIINARALFLF